VVSAGSLQVGGFLGWWIWLFIHIAFLTGYRNRLGAVLTWWLAFTRDIRRERTFTTQEVKNLRDIYASPLGAGAEATRQETKPAQTTQAAAKSDLTPRRAPPPPGPAP
jgi:hypothetical protein